MGTDMNTATTANICRVNVSAVMFSMTQYNSDFIVQCNDAEENYCFPGGSVKFGENHQQAIVREMQEQYGIEIVDSEMIMLYDKMSIKEYDFIYRGNMKGVLLDSAFYKFSEIKNKKDKEIKLVRRSLDELYKKSIFPKDMLKCLVKVIKMSRDDGSNIFGVGDMPSDESLSEYFPMPSMIAYWPPLF
jgi:8-oxo-dGTP diphosphatase